MIEYHVHIRYTDQFKLVGVREKMTEMRSIVEDHRVLLCIWLTFSLKPVVIPFGIDAVGPGLIFPDEYARLHNYEYFHERNDD